MSEFANLYDVVIVGGGPAGLTAAIYLARAQYRVVVVEKETFGGQITITSEVVNYPGVFKTSGKALTADMQKQGAAFGAEYMKAEVKSMSLEGDIKKIETDRGTLEAFGVLIATGAHPRMIGFEGEAEFRGHGVAYCATCDGEFFTGKEVFVIGGGFAAAEEGVFLTKYAKHVTIMMRSDDFKCAKATADEAKSNPNITIMPNTVVQSVEGDSVLRKITYKNVKTDEVKVFETGSSDTFGVFVFAGYEPETGLVKDQIELDRGYIVTDRNQKTSVDGVYAAGDVCIKNLRQVVTAVGDGALAATELEKHAAAMQKKAGQKPKRPEVPKPAPTEARSTGAAASAAARPAGAAGTSGPIDADTLSQLGAVFTRMQSDLILKLYLDGRPVSSELAAYMKQLAGATDRLSVETASDELPAEELPCVRILRADGTDTGLAFHGVPGGHEFTSFVLGLYNAAGPGQQIDAGLLEQVRAIDRPVDMRIMVSLSCTMCPELVMSAQRIAAENPNVRAEVYDLNHFPAMKDRYQVMSVPCFVINDGKPNFGKKDVAQLLRLIG